MKRLMMLVSVIGFLSMVILACAPSPVLTPVSPTSPMSAATPLPPTAAPPAEQKLTIAVMALPETIDGRHAAGEAWYVYNLMYDPLARVDEKGNPTPALAESWEVLNPTTWRFHLRKGVKFHNGEEFDAQDVKATFDYDLLPDNKYMNLSRIQFIKKVEVVDKYTVDFVTDKPNAAFFAAFVVVYIRPDEYFSKVGLQGFQKAPIGTGPFQFVEWQLGDHVSLGAYKDYWGGGPKLSTVKLRKMPEESTRLAALEAGEVDIVDQVGPEQIERVKGKGFTVASVLIGRGEVIFLGQDAVRPKALQDKRVRQAMAYAIDTDTIVKGLTLGYGHKLEGQLVGPDGFGFNPDLKAYPYDPQKAKVLLQEAGYASGISLRWEFAPRGFREKELAEAVAAYWKAVGIDVKLDVQDFATWSGKYLKGESGDVFHQPTNYMPSLDIDYILGTLDARKVWQDKKFVALLTQSRTELDANKRGKILREISAYVREEVPVIPVFQIPVIYAMSAKVRGVVLKPDSFIYLDKAYIQ